MSETKPKITSKEIGELQSLIQFAEGPQKVKLQRLLKLYTTKVVEKSGKETFLDFIQHVYPGYMIGDHHRKLAHIFEDIANGVKKRVIVNIAPRHGKSELISYLAPAWFLGKYPHKKLLWHLTQLILQLILGVVSVTLWVVMRIRTFFLK